MKFVSLATFALISVQSVESFSVLPGHSPSSRRFTTSPSPSFSSSALFSTDFDFPSAMPEKPQLTLEQRMQQSADEFVESMSAALGEGVEAPPELEELQQLRSKDTATPSELAFKIYELMIERGMRYDEAPETGTLTPTEFNIKENLDVKEVQDEFAHLYKYGMMLMDRGLLTPDQVKDTVLSRLIERTGLTPEEFDTWLGY